MKSEIERFTVYIKNKTSCWIWTGAKIGRNMEYGQFAKIRGTKKTTLAHRRIYELFYRKKLPKKLTIDHVCKNTICVNPLHMKPMSLVDNVLLGNGPMAINKRKTHCIYGHKFTKENTKKYPHKGQKNMGRSCLACRKIYYNLKT